MNNINKDSLCTFQGWNNQNDNNQDQLILSNILKRKTTIGTLPPLHDIKLRNSPHQQIHTQLKLETVRSKHFINKQSNNKQKRQKTEGFSEFYSDAISPLKKKLVQILNEEQTKNTPEPIIQQSLNQDLSQITFRKSQNNQQQSFHLRYKLNQRNIDWKPTQTFQKTNNNVNYDHTIKKTQYKMYMKLNALQMLNDFKKNVYQQSASIHNLTSKNRLFQQNEQKVKTKTLKHIILKKPQFQQKLEKVNLKMKQTFLKFDVFQKEKKKKQKIQRLDLLTQFNDQQIFSNRPHKMPQKSYTKRISPLKTIEKEIISHPNLSIPIKISKQKSPHRYKLTIN